jgi:hypothetical protein
MIIITSCYFEADVRRQFVHSDLCACLHLSRTMTQLLYTVFDVWTAVL